jgi:hypothetical protein
MVFIFISHLKSIDNYFILTGPLLNEELALLPIKQTGPHRKPFSEERAPEPEERTARLIENSRGFEHRRS